MLALRVQLLSRRLAFALQPHCGSLCFRERPLQLLTRLLIQHRHRAECRLQSLHLLVFGLVGLKGQLRQLRVDLRARDFFQQFGPLIWLRLQKRGKLPLRQQHRAQKTLAIQTGHLLDHRIHFPPLVGQDFKRGRICQRALHRLQISRLRLAQPPRRAQAPLVGFKIHLRQALARVPTHHLICLVIPIARRPPIERQRHRIQKRRFSSARRPRDEKHSRRAQRRRIKPHLMRPAEGVQILKSDGKKAHDRML